MKNIFIYLMAFLLFSTMANAQTRPFKVKYTFASDITALQFRAQTNGAVGYTYEIYDAAGTTLLGTSATGLSFSSATMSAVGAEIPLILSPAVPAGGKTIIITFEPQNLMRFSAQTNIPLYRNAFRDVLQWGDVVWTSMEDMFVGCANMTSITAADAPILNGVPSMSMFRMFLSCEFLTNVAGINSWNTENVTNMNNTFSFTPVFNQYIGDWDVSSVQDMEGMFSFCDEFNQDISKWNTTNVENMNFMFVKAHNFNQNIGNWNTAKVLSMTSMFQEASLFNQDISNWNVSKVTSMEYTFSDATNFNQNLGKWSLEAPALIYAYGMFANSGMSCENYTNTLNGWAANPNTKTGVD
jgi:surface protein